MVTPVMRSWVPFVGRPFGVFHSVIRLPHVLFEGIHGEVVVRRANVGVAKTLFDALYRGAVVARSVVGVHNDGDAELVFEVEKVFFLVADYNGNVGDTRRE